MAEDVKPQRFEIDTKEKLEVWSGDIAAWNNWGAEHLGEDFKPLDPDKPVHPILKGEAAMALWQAGRAEWNGWVKRNPRADIDFTDQKFKAQKYTYDGTPLVSFAVHKFPHGDIKFADAAFGEGDVSFIDTIFGEGSVSFRGATFGTRHVSFDRATFGDGIISFLAATFGDGIISFELVNFGKGNADFRGSSFGESIVDFQNCAFNGAALFEQLRKVEECEVFSFRGCSFEKLFTFSHKKKMSCPLDLRHTKLAHSLVVADIHCDYARGPQSDWSARLSNWLCAVPHWPHPERGYDPRRYFVGPPPAWPWRKKAAHREDSQRFRRLKELAVANRNHAKALEFHAREIQTARGHGTTFLQDLGQVLYWATSDYGRSVKRPLGWLIAVAGVFAAIYAALRKVDGSMGFSDALGPGLTFSLSQMFAFIPTGRTATEKSAGDLFGAEKIADVPYEIFAIGAVQTVLSVILLFLLSLGLRNMFRV